MIEKHSILVDLISSVKLVALALVLFYLWEIGTGQADEQTPSWRVVIQSQESTSTQYHNGGYASDSGTQCSSDDPNDSNQKVCVFRNGECQLVSPAAAPDNNTATECDENCQRRNCITGGTTGPANQLCCDPRENLWSWNDGRNRSCTDASSRPNCIPQGASISEARLAVDDSIGCCEGLIQQQDECVTLSRGGVSQSRGSAPFSRAQSPSPNPLAASEGASIGSGGGAGSSGGSSGTGGSSSGGSSPRPPAAHSPGPVAR